MKRDIIIDHVKEILKGRTRKITLRKIFYKLLAKLVIKNTESSYKWLSKILVDARRNGDIPDNAIEDRQRRPKGGDDREESTRDYFEGWYNYFRSCWKHYTLPKWMYQPNYVEVWIEKEAIESDFEFYLQDRNVLLCACKGYPSFTFLRESAKRLKVGDVIVSLVVADEIIVSPDEVNTFSDQELAVFHKECSPFKENIFE